MSWSLYFTWCSKSIVIAPKKRKVISKLVAIETKESGSEIIVKILIYLFVAIGDKVILTNVSSFIFIALQLHILND